MTESAALNLQSSAFDKKKNNDRLCAYVTGVDWRTIIALELHYHQTCYKQLTRRDTHQHCHDVYAGQIHDRLMPYVKKHVLDNMEVLSLDSLREFLISSDDNDCCIPHKRTLADFVLKHFEDKVALWSPKYGNAFLFNNSIEKGRIIEILFKTIERLKEKLKPSSIESEIDNVGRAVKDVI